MHLLSLVRKITPFLLLPFFSSVAWCGDEGITFRKYCGDLQAEVNSCQNEFNKFSAETLDWTHGCPDTVGESETEFRSVMAGGGSDAEKRDIEQAHLKIATFLKSVKMMPGETQGQMLQRIFAEWNDAYSTCKDLSKKYP